MAVWLAERVGTSGRVVATDIDVTYLKRLNLPNLEVCQHNILDDPLDTLGPASFDLVCSRLMLFWLPGKQETAIQRMAECLRPGGWLVDEAVSYTHLDVYKRQAGYVWWKIPPCGGPSHRCWQVDTRRCRIRLSLIHI